jgi:alpha-glucosidase (family GH31 glycosyl hydrolase)
MRKADLRRLLAGCAIVAACGDNTLPPAPDVLVAGPVTIDTRTLTLTIGSLSIERFVSVGVTDRIIETHYYDPRGGDPAVGQVTPARVLGAEGNGVILEGGTRLVLAPCAIPRCAVLELDASAHPRAVQLQLALPKDPAEPLYGTGDAARAANVAGSVREMQLRVDPRSESALNETHVPVPLVLWPRRGIGLFAADDRPAALDLGATVPHRVTTTFTLPARGRFQFFLFTADSPVELVRTYVALTAAPALPPRWAFAPQQWRNAWASSDEVREDADAMRARRIPGSVMWIDNPWQTGYNTFVVDEARLAEPARLIADLAERGYKVVFWSTPYVGVTPVTAADRAEGATRRLFVTDDVGVVIDFPWQDGPGALVDFTAPGAIAWWRERIARITAIGAAGFKLDFGEEIVPDIAGTIVPMQLAGGDNSTHHSRYAEGYHAAYLGALPEEDRFLITRAGAWGEQRVNPAIWPGDLDSDFTQFGDDNGAGMINVGGLPSAISRGLSLSVSGYPFYGSDIGGFRGFPTTEALLRWAQYAAFGTIMQLGGGGRSHNPWDDELFEPGADAIYKVYADLHMQLNPLLWTLAIRAAGDGTPVTVPAAFVADCACDDAMFLLGDDILVAPVIEAGATTRSVVLPPGEWRDVESGAYATGDGASSITVPAPLAVLPRWYRAGSLVPMFARHADTILPAAAPGVTSYVDPALGRELRLVYTPGTATASPATTILHDGARANATGATITVTGGAEYTVFTVDVDTRTLAAPFAAPRAVTVDESELSQVADVTSCAPPGCFALAGDRLEIRVFAEAVTRTIAID